MTLPFSREEFFGVFARYNESLWPAQVLIYLLALGAVAFALRRTKDASRGAYAILAILWLWMGVAYHAALFTKIDPLAGFFAVAFIAQGFLFGGLAARRNVAVMAPRSTFSGWAGAGLVAFGLLGYPLLSLVEGHFYPYQPTFGLPCPTTIFTLGFVVWAWNEIPRIAIVIPILWAATGTLASLQLGVPEDLSLAGALIVVGLTALMSEPVGALRVGAQRTS
jgi:hypothetical protein